MKCICRCYSPSEREIYCSNSEFVFKLEGCKMSTVSTFLVDVFGFVRVEA